MLFYLLGFVLALVTIFGLAHSHIASENLHLQNLCAWSSSTIRCYLQEHNLFDFQDRSDANQIVDIVEITVTQAEVPEYNNPDTSEVIEEIQGIKLGAERLAEEDSNVQIDEEQNAVQSSTNETQPSESRDSVLSAINASLRRLSSAATSGRLNGAQLYQILLRETLLHEKPTKNENTELSSAPSSSTVTLETVAEDEGAEPKVKMYFGNSPLEYVPHQK